MANVLGPGWGGTRWFYWHKRCVSDAGSLNFLLLIKPWIFDSGCDSE